MTHYYNCPKKKSLPTRVAFSSETLVQRSRDVFEEIFLGSVNGLWTRQLVHPGKSSRHPVNLRSNKTFESRKYKSSSLIHSCATRGNRLARSSPYLEWLSWTDMQVCLTHSPSLVQNSKWCIGQASLNKASLPHVLNPKRFVLEHWLNKIYWWTTAETFL